MSEAATGNRMEENNTKGGRGAGGDGGGVEAGQETA